MSMYGADPTQLAALGQNLRRQIESVNAITSTVSAALSGTTWTGPARDRFEQDWTGTFRTALDRLSQAFDAAGLDCVRRAEQLQQVMGVHG